MNRPEYIMEILRQRRGYEPEDTTIDDELSTLTNSEVLNEVATWEGLIQYGATIMQWVEDIFDVDLK